MPTKDTLITMEQTAAPREMMDVVIYKVTKTHMYYTATETGQKYRAPINPELKKAGIIVPGFKMKVGVSNPTT